MYKCPRCNKQKADAEYCHTCGSCHDCDCGGAEYGNVGCLSCGTPRCLPLICKTCGVCSVCGHAEKCPTVKAACFSGVGRNGHSVKTRVAFMRRIIREGDKP